MVFVIAEPPRFVAGATKLLPRRGSGYSQAAWTLDYSIAPGLSQQRAAALAEVEALRLDEEADGGVAARRRGRHLALFLRFPLSTRPFPSS